MLLHKDNLISARTLARAIAILASCILLSWVHARELSADKPKPPALVWHSVTPDDVVGQGWRDTKSPFDRLPARAEKIVRGPIWELSRNSTGLYIDFTTDATSISTRWTLTFDRLAMPHMPATGVSGLALYINRDDKWHYLATGQPTKFPTNEVELVKGLPPGSGHYRIYFPLYNGVSAVEIGVPTGVSFDFKRQPDRHVKPVVIYGTSITQGGCASQPGMSFAAILGRRLNVPVINLGFSGNGKAEKEMAELLCEIDASVFILDPLPNLFAEQVDERLPTFIHTLRKLRPNTPILLNESPRYPAVAFLPEQMRRVNESNRILDRIGKSQAASGDKHITVITAADLAAESGETTVDGIHPTDVGFVIMADAIEPTLRKTID